MKEPKSRAGASGKATRTTRTGPATVKTKKSATPAEATAATKSARAAKASVSERTATPTKTASTARAATRDRTAGAADYRKEIDSLRREVERLKAQVAGIDHRAGATIGNRGAGEEAHPWLKIAATVGVTFVLGKLMQALRVPAAAAVAVPLITAEVNRRFL